LDGLVSLALVLSGLIILVGFICNYLFERTGFPDMLLLIVLGILLGPVIPVVIPNFDLTSLMELAPYLSALALIFILFDGGIKMNIYQVFSESPRAVLLAVLSFTFSMLTITFFMTYLVGFDMLYALLFGSIYGGSSSIAVISVAQRIKISEKCSTVLSLESAVTDILCIVVTLAIMGIILGAGQADYTQLTRNIASQFSTGAVIGVILGALWLSILQRVSKFSYAYMLTLGILLFAYALSENLGGNGALSCLLFGIVLGNEREINRMLKRELPKSVVVDGGLKRFESEIAFLIRSFFFVYLGLIASISNVLFIFYGIILSFILLIVRFAAVSIATVRSELWLDRTLMSMVLTRGLAAAVLSTLPKQFPEVFDSLYPGISDWYVNIAVVIILCTTIICTIGVLSISRKH